MIRFPVWATGVGLAAALMLVGCAGGGDGSAAPSSTTTEPVAPLPPPVAAEDLDGCGLLTPEEAAEAVEAPSVEAEPWPVPSASDEDVMTTGCTYADPEPGALAKTVVAVHVYPNARTARFWFDETRRRNDYEYLPGLGDLAYVPLEEVGDFEVLVGAYWLKVSVERARYDEGPGEDDAAARDVVELALSRLPT